jgi:acetyl esterase/lipase
MWVLMLTLMLVLPGATAWAVVPPTAPEQPLYGFGGRAYTHQSIRATRIGAYEDKFYLFEPAQPAIKTAPVVVFLHGWMHSHPDYYRAWIDHLVRRGNIVIFPCYQSMGEPIEHFFANTIRSIKEALVKLVDGTHTEPDRDRFSCIGHEGGGVLALNFTATARYFKLPVPKAVSVLMPSMGPGGRLASGLEWYDLSKIPADTLMQVVVGDDDRHNGHDTAIDAFYKADVIDHHNKEFLTLVSDLRGTPGLVADRFSPLCPLRPLLWREIDRRRLEFIHLYKEPFTARSVRTQAGDAHDWNGLWRLFDALCSAAFTGEGRELALGDSQEVLSLGHWSDDRPIRPLLSSKRP